MSIGFWIFLSAVWVCDAWLYSKGHNGFFHHHKTDAEKAIRDRQARGEPHND